MWNTMRPRTHSDSKFESRNSGDRSILARTLLRIPPGAAVFLSLTLGQSLRSHPSSNVNGS